MYEPEPYSVLEQFEDSFPFDRSKSFDENITDFHAYMQEIEDDYDPYEEPETEPEEPKKELVVNDDLLKIFNEVLNNVLAKFKADGIEFISYMDSLIVAATERLNIRQFISGDLVICIK